VTLIGERVRAWSGTSVIVTEGSRPSIFEERAGGAVAAVKNKTTRDTIVGNAAHHGGYAANVGTMIVASVWTVLETSRNGEDNANRYFRNG